MQIKGSLFDHAQSLDLKVARQGARGRIVVLFWAAALTLLCLPNVFGQSEAAPIKIEEAALRAAASVYPAPQYPPASVQAGHSGKVIVEVVIAPATPTSPLARVQSSTVVSAPDSDMANAVLATFKDVRYMPFFDDDNHVQKASGRIVSEFRLEQGKPEVVDPYAPAHRDTETAEQIASDDLKIAQQAQKILSSESVWNRADNRQCPPKAKTVSLYCALERATLEVTGSFDHRGTVMEDARSAIDVVAPRHPDYGHWLMGYNNDPTTSFADIQKVLKVAEQTISNRIAKNRPQ